ncbi:MAG TPA: aspartate-semialdehyde dehydrogenase [Alphaproteobacteria bacterium]|nr:aspartate-semialdehyde dehydrogenase [Alphaproteobacteria bacterium]
MSNGRQSLSNPRVAIVGATGAVGIEMIRCLEQRNFPLTSLRLFASGRSAGKPLPFRGKDILVEELNEETFRDIDLALFSASSGISKHYGPLAVAQGAVVVDNSSAFRMDPSIPLVVPEINASAVDGHPGIIANPNCAAIISITPLWPLHKINPLRRLIVSTYQAASGAGAAAMEELRVSTEAHLAGKDYTPKVLPHPYAFNLFSHNTAIDPETGYNGEESKVIAETRKIFGEPNLPVSATCVRVPVLRAHSVAITAEFTHPMAPGDVRRILATAPGVRLVDNPEKNYFPMPIDAQGQDDILVGRIRQDLSDPSGRSIAMFVAGDQLLKGAALNAVQIAELLLA